MNKETIVNILQQEKKEIAKLGVSKIGLFGSFSRNDFKEDSDIDILIDFEPNSEVTLFDLIEIEELLNSRLNRKVDMALLATLKPQISKHIMSEVIFV